MLVPSSSSFQTAPPPCSPPHALQALARLCLYKWLAPEEMPESPDAVFFPGKPAAGVQPLAGTVTRYLIMNGNKAGTYWQAVGLWGLAGQVSSGWIAGWLAADKRGHMAHCAVCGKRQLGTQV